jgi:ubiquinol-cytochrome c reductase iron-sulfur subunit
MVPFFSVTTQVRFYHTDIQVPDFSAYRRKDVKDSTAVSRDSEDARKSFTYLVVGGLFNKLFCFSLTGVTL